MRRTALIAPAFPQVCRLGLATRGGSGLQARDVLWAFERGVNYLNWCGHPDGLSAAVAAMGRDRSRAVVAVQFQARSTSEAAREFDSLLEQLATDYLDVATLYYVESTEEWAQVTAPGGVWEYLDVQRKKGRLRLIGLTSHQRSLAASWAGAGALDLLMIRYNAAHRGAETDVFPAAAARGIPVVTFTGLRWGALTKPTREDPPGFEPPPPAAWYRFCLANPHVAVALAAPANRAELEHDLALLHDWRAPAAEEMEALRAHGDRVLRNAGAFW
jgi:predicted aldo/keto reductase-like oxidoreductase